MQIRTAQTRQTTALLAILVSMCLMLIVAGPASARPAPEPQPTKSQPVSDLPSYPTPNDVRGEFSSSATAPKNDRRGEFSIPATRAGQPVTASQPAAVASDDDTPWLPIVLGIAGGILAVGSGVLIARHAHRRPARVGA